jgi:serine/threonine protein kinase
LGPAEFRSLVQQTVWTLAYVHVRGLAHGDLKPDNILYNASTWTAVLADFGCQQLRDAEWAKQGTAG